RRLRFVPRGALAGRTDRGEGRRSPAGWIVTAIARGKIKVDARRALGKLRDHMLVDPHLYATEIARAAVALGAARLELDWDSDDVRIGFAGAALDPLAIARLR